MSKKRKIKHRLYKTKRRRRYNPGIGPEIARIAAARKLYLEKGYSRDVRPAGQNLRGSDVRAHRLRLDLKQREAAQICNRTQGWLGQIEAFRGNLIPVGRLASLAPLLALESKPTTIAKRPSRTLKKKKAKSSRTLKKKKTKSKKLRSCSICGKKGVNAATHPHGLFYGFFLL